MPDLLLSSPAWAWEHACFLQLVSSMHTISAHPFCLLRYKYLKGKDIFLWHFINNHIALVYCPEDRKTGILSAVNSGCILGQKIQTEGEKYDTTGSMNLILLILGSSLSLVYCTQPKPATVKNQFPKNNHTAKNTNVQNTVGLHTWRG